MAKSKLAERIAERLFDDYGSQCDRLMQMTVKLRRIPTSQDLKDVEVAGGGWCKTSVIRIINEELSKPKQATK